ncbi:MAG: hypothetical protein D3913_15260 [Candidatus Electrothrix sp. LOE1_4_5]|nr:hypothetical protein [Candidatus Electrothrix sp. AX1]MCI5119262.1 hypothetical protein [Candidatus Electrothrix gigas]MCI5183849.1 hypothetical protein [Candidatus Electrothrix gigas]MCI5196757.1 hypothetical protein [Candidatus Electrothrix gigas]MCI5227691.1 hypothetical protein [Candidatus Electrothrix gigas]
MLQGDIALRLREIIMEICAQNKMDIISGNIRSNYQLQRPIETVRCSSS